MKHENLPDNEQQEKLVGKDIGDGSVTWKWMTALLMTIVLAIGGYLYKVMADDVRDIKKTVISIREEQIRTQVKQERIDDFMRRYENTKNNSGF